MLNIFKSGLVSVVTSYATQAFQIILMPLLCLRLNMTNLFFLNMEFALNIHGVILPTLHSLKYFSYFIIISSYIFYVFLEWNHKTD